jgi:4-alpha-glucanotransferase
VLVDSEYVQPVTPMRWEKLRYRPHLARFGGEEIIVVTRDRKLSNAQEGGMEPGLLQWTGSQAQQEALIRLAEISQAIHAARRNAIAMRARDPELYRLLAEAHWRALRAETSCNFFWGQAWVPRVHHDLDQASRLLDEAGAHFS